MALSHRAMFRCFHYCNEVQSRCYGGALDVELVFQSSNNMGVATRHHAARDILPFEIPMSPVHHPSIGQESGLYNPHNPSNELHISCTSGILDLGLTCVAHIGDLETSSEGLGSGCGRMMRNNDPVPVWNINQISLNPGCRTRTFWTGSSQIREDLCW
ncbi:hypothetical protein IAQ61_009433 [Plenodomus lingam]|uniref:uncharacterized protein n=1 Tax=Leptosphaeria maculans TaxID=5022 RepID=UPI00331D3D93|nr:hypothetical protein IAQ61_009433 [Plenodomus lingam]